MATERPPTIRHSGAAKRNPESRAPTVKVRRNAAHHGQYRIDFVDKYKNVALWIPGSASRPRNDEIG